MKYPAVSGEKVIFYMDLYLTSRMMDIFKSNILIILMQQYVFPVFLQLLEYYSGPVTTPCLIPELLIIAES